MYTDNKFKKKHVYENSPIYFMPIPMYQDEVFVDVKIPDVMDYYMISNYGRLYNKYGNYFIKTFIGSNGYERASNLMKKDFGKKNYSIHRMVMEAFVPNHEPEKCLVNHINGNKADNRLCNLEWCTPSYNSQDMILRGLREKGDDFSMCKINLEIAHRICQLLQDTDYTAKQIAEIVGPPATTDIVSGIMKGRYWKHVSCNYKFRPRAFSHVMTEEIAHDFCKYFETHPKIPGTTNGEYCEQACIDLGYDPTYRLVNTLITIFCHRTWKQVSSQYDF